MLARPGLWSSQPWLWGSRAIDLRAAVWELPRRLASVQGVGTQVADPSGRHGLCQASRPSGTRGAESWVQRLRLGSPTAGPRTRQGSPLGEGACLQTPRGGGPGQLPLLESSGTEQSEMH